MAEGSSWWGVSPKYPVHARGAGPTEETGSQTTLFSLIMADKEGDWNRLIEQSESEVFRPGRTLQRSPSRVERQISNETPKNVSQSVVSGSQPGTTSKRGRESPEQMPEEIRRRRTDSTERTQPDERSSDLQMIMAEINTIMAIEKMSANKKQVVFEHFSKLQILFQSLLIENQYLKGQNDILKLNSTQTTPKTYASAATQPLIPSLLKQRVVRESAPRCTVFISAKDKSSKDLQKIMTQNINPAKDKINIRSMRSTEKVLILETESEKDIEKLNENEALKKHQLVIEKPRKKDPLMIIYDLPTTKEEQEIKDTLYHQNFEQLLSKEQFMQKFNVRFKAGPRGKSTVHHVAEVAADLRKLILNKGRVYLDFTSHSVKDYVVVARCMKCQDLGHVAKYCRKQNSICSHCGEQDHAKTECQKKEQPPVCVPCNIRKKKCKGKKECPTHRMMLERLIQRTDYG